MGPVFSRSQALISRIAHFCRGASYTTLYTHYVDCELVLIHLDAPLYSTLMQQRTHPASMRCLVFRKTAGNHYTFNRNPEKR